MKTWLKGYLLLEKDIGSSSYRKEVTGNFVILFSFFLLTTLTISNFFFSSLPIFYTNLGLLTGLALTFFLFKSNKKYIVHSIAVVMCVGIFLIVYVNQGQGYTPIWSFLFIYLIMSLYGHKKGLLISAVFLLFLLALLAKWLGDGVSSLEYVRFAFVSLFTLFFAYLAELLIARTFKKLHATQLKLEKMTKTDALTGLHNRRHFNEILVNKINSAKRSKELLALAIIDIDHFKMHNDKFGHPAGDAALVALAKLLQETMKRSDDVLFRLGGEEFALVYKPKDDVSAIALLEKIRHAVERLDISQGVVERITISAGLSLIKPHYNTSFEQVYKATDDLLYQAKELGRNRVVVSP